MGRDIEWSNKNLLAHVELTFEDPDQVRYYLRFENYLSTDYKLAFAIMKKDKVINWVTVDSPGFASVGAGCVQQSVFAYRDADLSFGAQPVGAGYS